jgi:hypothetical protein
MKLRLLALALVPSPTTHDYGTVKEKTVLTTDRTVGYS